jgi:molybdate transport system regulatory protein
MHNEMDYSVNGKLWVQSDQGIFLGEGRVELLKAIHEHGSISKASKAIGISYRKAWKLVQSMNENGSCPIVNQSAGGNKGGGTTLSEKGKEIIELYDKLKGDYNEFLEEKSKEYSELWK